MEKTKSKRLKITVIILSVLIVIVAGCLAGLHYAKKSKQDAFMDQACYVFTITSPDHIECFNPHGLKQISATNWSMGFVDQNGSDQKMTIKKYPNQTFIETYYISPVWGGAFNH